MSPQINNIFHTLQSNNMDFTGKIMGCIKYDPKEKKIIIYRYSKNMKVSENYLQVKTKIGNKNNRPDENDIYENDILTVRTARRYAILVALEAEISILENVQLYADTAEVMIAERKRQLEANFKEFIEE